MTNSLCKKFFDEDAKNVKEKQMAKVLPGVDEPPEVTYAHTVLQALGAGDIWKVGAKLITRPKEPRLTVFYFNKYYFCKFFF